MMTITVMSKPCWNPAKYNVIWTSAPNSSLGTPPKGLHIEWVHGTTSVLSIYLDRTAFFLFPFDTKTITYVPNSLKWFMCSHSSMYSVSEWILRILQICVWNKFSSTLLCVWPVSTTPFTEEDQFCVFVKVNKEKSPFMSANSCKFLQPLTCCLERGDMLHHDVLSHCVFKGKCHTSLMPTH